MDIEVTHVGRGEMGRDARHPVLPAGAADHCNTFEIVDMAQIEGQLVERDAKLDRTKTGDVDHKGNLSVLGNRLCENRNYRPLVVMAQLVAHHKPQGVALGRGRFDLHHGISSPSRAGQCCITGRPALMFRAQLWTPH